MANRDPHVVDWKQPCSIPWFRLYMRLPGRGVSPVDLPEDLKPSRDVVVHFFGPESEEGFTFDPHGNQDYEDYVRDLFNRVLQLKWHPNSVIPFEFARALVLEACDLEVNWADFAFEQTHPLENAAGMPRLLSVFRNLPEPLQQLRKVIPVSNIKEVAFLKVEKQTVSPVLKKEKPPAHVTPPGARNRSSPSAEYDADVKTGFLYPTMPAPAAGGIGRSSASPTLDPGATNALGLLKGKFTNIIEAEQVRLRSAPHHAFEPLADLAERLVEEKEKLKHVLRRASEKQGSYDRAMTEYANCRAALVTPRDKGSPQLNEDNNGGKKPVKNLGDILVNSWKENVDLAKKRVASWDFKCKRQYMAVSKAQKKLAEAEATYRAECLGIETDMKNIRALQNFLSHL